MPRGSNYVNNNKGVRLQASHKKRHAHQTKMQDCLYGAGCTRPNCIYRHPNKEKKAEPQSKSPEPCMAHLAGICTFTAAGCRKTHVSKSEAEKLIAKYRSTPCRYGKDCKTKGCLFIHPQEGEEKQDPTACVEPFSTPYGEVQRQPTLMANYQTVTPPVQTSAWEYTPGGTRYVETARDNEITTDQSSQLEETSLLSVSGTNPDAKEFFPGRWNT